MPFLNKLLKILGIRKGEANILVVGLDNSGKTTILNCFKSRDEKTEEVVPTVGFNVERFKTSNVNFTAFDMSGQGRYRNLWEHYYKNVQGIIFVIDSSDSLRLVVAKEELDLMLKHSEIEGKPNIPILLYANKMDLREAMSSVKISQGLGLTVMKNRPWHIQASNALSGEGLQEGIQWLTEQLTQQKQLN
ncbi:ADP ribosylation factor 79F-like protein [Leptotrombidium deliense]|uniref:ADP-ribosylation factor-like protein 6 n=1 Tax=Leptotrombidium deliense TaxID=299467 RepID=A0A443SA01_9ACAR|nr:ADP ribosylation factor 79F-like protein [Leptotrombidium deliense]